MAGADPLLPGVYFVVGEWMQNVVRIPGDAYATGRLGRYLRQGLFGEDIRNEPWQYPRDAADAHPACRTELTGLRPKRVVINIF